MFKVIKFRMLSHRNSCKYYNTSIVIINQGLDKVTYFFFGTWENSIVKVDEGVNWGPLVFRR